MELLYLKISAAIICILGWDYDAIESAINRFLSHV
jgi:hypothetical protein